MSSEKIETSKEDILLDDEELSIPNALEVLNAADAVDRAMPGSRPVIILLMTMAVSGAVFVITAVYFIFVFGIYQWTWDASARTITTGAPSRSLSTILMVVSHVVNFSVVVGTTLHIYNVCAMWLKVSKGIRGTGDVEANEVGFRQAAAAQLDLLVSVLKSGGVGTWMKACFHLLHLRQSRRDSPTFGVLVSAVFVAGSLLIMSYISTGFELWLNDSTYPAEALLDSSSAISLTGYGRELNETQCDYYATQLAPVLPLDYQYMTQLCGLSVAGANLPVSLDDLAFPSAGEGSRLLSNSSDRNDIAYTEDQQAILIDGIYDTTVSDSTDQASYVASTLGVHSSCQTITRACTPGWSSGIIPWDCSQSGLNVIINSDTTGGIVNPTNGTVGSAPGVTTAYNLINSNTFRVAQLVKSYAYSYDSYFYDRDGTDPGYVGNTGFVWTSTGGYNVMLCDISVNDVIFEYTPVTADTGIDGTYVTRSVSAASTNTTRLVANVVDFSFLWTGGVSTRVDGVGFLYGNYTLSYALELSRELVAYAAAAYQDADASSGKGMNDLDGSQIPLVPMVLYFLTVVFYGVFTLWIGIRAYLMTVGNPEVQRAHLRLTRPLTALEHLDGRGRVNASLSTGERKGPTTVSQVTRAASHKVAGELFEYMTGSI